MLADWAGGLGGDCDLSVLVFFHVDAEVQTGWCSPKIEQPVCICELWLLYLISNAWLFPVLPEVSADQKYTEDQDSSALPQFFTLILMSP